MPPTAPVQILANQTGASAPTAPVTVLPAAAAGGESLIYATATLSVLGNAVDGAVSILGYGFGLEQTTPASGLTLAETYAAELAEEINAFFDGFGFRPIATVTGAVVTLTANLPGIAGNQIDVSSSDADVVASGAYLSGGGGDPTIVVGGTLTKNGSTGVTFPVLAVDQSRSSAEVEYSSTGWDYDTGGPALTGWHYTAQITTVLTGTFPDLVLVGYRWQLKASRYTAGSLSESASWQSATQPSTHPVESATGWAAVSPATGTPTVTVPTFQGFLAPVQITADGGSGSSPTAPVQITANGGGSSPTAPVQITANGSSSSPTAPPVVLS
jgi:hypothetical protein